MDAKPAWASKTMWTNIIGAAALLSSAAGINLGLDPQAQTQLVAGVLVVANVILRFVTKQPVRIKKEKSQ